MQTSVMALLGLGSLLVGWILMFVIPGSRVFSWGILALGAALVAAALVTDFRRVRGALASGKGKFGLGTSVTVSLFLGIILLANGISVGLYHRFDFTGLAQFTLTSQTKDVLADLDEPVEIVTMFTPKIPPAISTYAQNLLAEYKVYSDQLTIKEIDPDLQPDQARQYGLDQAGALLGSVVFQSQSGQRQVYGPQIASEAEHAFTSALLEVTGTRQKRVYFLTGHGESSIDQTYASAGDGLKDNLFQVEPLDLMTTPEIPQDTAVLVIAGPRRPLSTVELATVREYLANDGRLFLLLDPNPPEVYRRLLAEWWLQVEDGFIVDPSSYVAPNRDNPLVPRTRNTFQLGETFFTGATALISEENQPAGVELGALVWTSPEAWLEKSSLPGQEAVFEPDLDRKGPLAMGALVSTTPAGETAAAEGTRLVVIGDSDFAANQNFRNGANSDLFLTSVNWLTAGEEIISIDRKVLVTRRLLLNPEQARFLQLSSMGLLPLLFLVAGAYVWWKRR